jgi:hypothetical protein
VPLKNRRFEKGIGIIQRRSRRDKAMIVKKVMNFKRMVKRVRVDRATFRKETGIINNKSGKQNEAE